MDLSDLIDTANNSDRKRGQQRTKALADELRSAEEQPDLASIIEDSSTEFGELYNDGQYDPAQAERMYALADVLDAARTVDGEQQAAREEMDRELAEMSERVQPQNEQSDDNGEQPDEGDDEGGKHRQDEQPEQQPAEPAPEQPSAPQEQSRDEQPVPASAARESRSQPAKQRVSSKQINANRSNPSPQNQSSQRSVSITASAEVPDVPLGKNLSQSELAEASLARFATFPYGQQTSGPLKANVARIERHDPNMLRGDNSDIATIDAVADEKKLPGGSLVAAAQQQALTAADQAPSVYNDVWCSVSETIFDLCPALATTDGMWDVPTTTINRGGIRYPVWTQYPNQPELDDPDGTKTNAKKWRGEVVQYPDPAENPGTGIDNPGYFWDKSRPGGLGNLKKCISGPCVDWKEVRESLVYLCVESDILRDSTWPELTRRFIDDVMIHHQHYLNETYLAYVEAHSDPLPAYSANPEPTAGANNQYAMGSSSQAVADRVALLVAWFRNTYRLAEGSTLELVAPEWFREYLKRDIERKKNRPFGTATNSEVASLFASYSSRVQWVRDWQDIPNGAPVMEGTTPVRVMPPNSWPNTVKIMAYPAGSWVLGQRNILNLGVQYDWQLLHENRAAQMFTEDAWLLLNRCDRSFIIELTDLCANGAVGTEQEPIKQICQPTPPPASSGSGSDDGGESAKSASKK